MTWDGGFKTRIAPKKPKGVKSKSLIPALGRHRHNSQQLDGVGSFRVSVANEDSIPSLLGLPGMLKPGMVDGSAQSAVWSTELHSQDDLIVTTPSPPPNLEGPETLPPPHLRVSPKLQEISIAKLSYPLFSNTISNVKQLPKAAVGGTLKEGGLEKSTPLEEGFAKDNVTLPVSVPATVLSGSTVLNSTSESPLANTMVSPSSSLQNPCSSENTAPVTNITATMEEVMGQILMELRAIKVSQEETRWETKDRLTQLNTHLTLLLTRVSQVEQRFSYLEDIKNQVESTTSQVQSELENLQMKLDEMENRSQRSNLKFVGVPESGSLVTKVVSKLICKSILRDLAKSEGDLSIMRAHRVPFVRPTN
ncbi:hypothetical protein NDU88_007791 [Pleurodeles waltl]|uniref:Uncharacterized protein n=1 Tax=Pleurodeles waltl TaxID=8319 RepID=A0AAV7VTK4_PLEWA|nr:hypothetical protein NDU88_007791 [Pleurodeles waltl]